MKTLPKYKDQKYMFAYNFFIFLFFTVELIYFIAFQMSV